MLFYGDSLARRTRQIIIDVVAILLVALWVALGRWVYGTISSLADYGVRVEEAGNDFANKMSSVASSLADVPLVGEAASTA